MVQSGTDSNNAVQTICPASNKGSPPRLRYKSATLQLFLETLLVIFLCQAVLTALLYAISADSTVDIVLDSVLLLLVTIALVYRLIVRPVSNALNKCEQAERLLQASGQMYRQLYESSSDAIILASPQKGILSANAAALTLLACGSEAAVSGRRFSDFAPPCQPDGSKSSEKEQQIIETALEKGTYSFDWKCRKTDNTEFPARILLTCTQLEGRSLIQAAIRDTTEQAKLEDRLRSQVKQLDCLYGLSPLVERPETALGEILENATTLIRNAYQQPSSTCVRITFDGIQYRTENFRKTETSQFAAIPVAGQQPGGIEVYYLGERAEEAKDPFLPAERDLLNAVAERLGLIAETKRAADKLRMFRNLIDRSNDAILVVEPEWGRIIDANEKACEALGYERQELLEMTVTEIEQSLPNHDAWTQHVNEVRQKQNMMFEGAHRRKDGTTFAVEVNVGFVSHQNQGLLLAVARDITERKKAEQKQAQLLKEVESANQELKDFAYIISHDLKAPLRAIKALTDWLAADYSDKFDDEGKEQMKLLLSRVGRMHNLIDGVLQYSRVGRIKEEHVRIDLNELLPEIIDLLAPPANIHITVQNQLPAVVCERTRIHQVFQNLLSNAVKYMDKPEGFIKVGCTEEDGFWNFSVCDNGPGIEEQHFEKIFKIFQTLQAKDQFESTGVGLTLVKKIVELYGGRIWLTSKVGEGATFFFTLPKVQQGQSAEQAARPQQQTPSPEPQVEQVGVPAQNAPHYRPDNPK